MFGIPNSALLAVGGIVVAIIVRRRLRRRHAAGGAGLPDVTPATKFWMLYCLIRFRISWGVHNCKRDPVDTVKANPGVDPEVVEGVRKNGKFIAADAVASQIQDGEVVFTAGFPSSERVSIFHWAVGERFKTTGHPCNLTWMSTSGQGTRGKVPGSADELAAQGNLKQYITGHVETVKGLLKAASRPDVAAQLPMFHLPQGILAYLVRAQSEGKPSIDSPVGIGTCFDPSVEGAHGGFLNDAAKKLGAVYIERLADVEPGSNRPLLRYRIPLIQTVLFHARYADTEGNIYLDKNTTITETRSAIAAAKKNQSLGHYAKAKVFASVNFVRTRASDTEIAELKNLGLFISKDEIDGVVIFNDGAQRDTFGIRDELSIRHDKSKETLVSVYQSLKFVNKLLKITPKREPVEFALGRLAAHVFCTTFSAGLPREKNLGCIGVGLPEEACQYLFARHICPEQVTLSTETGTIGGLPGAGIFFGNAIHPDRLIESIDIFKLWETNLNTCLLGAIEVDSHGNVNVSKKGPKTADFVGAGGFANIVTYAKNIVIVTRWVTGSKAVHISSKTGHVSINYAKVRGPKFVGKIREITFCADEAIRRGATVTYCTEVAVFRKTKDNLKGLELVEVAPGIDIDRDIIQVAKVCTFIIPAAWKVGATAENPYPGAQVIKRSILTGNDFHLALPA
jgi:propionate CoA-transferase